jgi:hypothetical protein
LDLELLQSKMLDEEMHEAQPEPEAAAEDQGEDEDDISKFRNQFEGQPDPEVFPWRPIG